METKIIKKKYTAREISKVSRNSQITIPKSIRKKLEIKEGDTIEFRLTENGELLLKPVVIIDKDQAWFWTPEWQEGERETDEDIKAGRVTKPMSLEELMKHLESFKQ